MRFDVGITVLRQYDRLKQCVEAVKSSTLQPDNIIIIDNGRCLGSVPGCTVIMPPDNLGVAASWNLLLKLIHPRVAIITQDDCIVAMDTFSRLMAPSPPALVTGMGFSCFRQDPEITEWIGQYDENYYPAYYEDGDYKMRMKEVGAQLIDMGNIVESHGNHGEHPYQFFSEIDKVLFDTLVEKNKQRFIRKWGGLPSEVGI